MYRALVGGADMLLKLANFVRFSAISLATNPFMTEKITNGLMGFIFPTLI